MSAGWTRNVLPEEEDHRRDALSAAIEGYEMVDGDVLDAMREHAFHVVPGRGSVTPLVVLVGEAPGEQEDRHARPFVGPAGQLLSELLREVGLDEEVDVYLTNTVKYRPVDGQGRNRKPRQREVDASLPLLDQELELLDPLLVVPLGSVALRALHPTGPSITDGRGRAHVVTDRPGGLMLLPTWYPSAALRDPTGQKAFDMGADLRLAAELVAPGRDV